MKILLQLIRRSLSRYHYKDYKFSLVFLVMAISVIGVFVVRSADPSYQNKQILGILLGIVAMVVISLFDYNWVLNFYWVMYVMNLVLLGAVLVVGTNVNGATRWLNLGFVQFQPSDLTKIISILFYARLLTKKENAVRDPKMLVAGIALLVPSLILIYKQPNLSNTICVALLFCVLMYMGGLSYKFIGVVLAIGVPLFVGMFIWIIQPDQPFLEQYQQNRILAWLYPEEYESEEAYQQLNSVMADRKSVV